MPMEFLPFLVESVFPPHLHIFSTLFHIPMRIYTCSLVVPGSFSVQMFFLFFFISLDNPRYPRNCLGGVWALALLYIM